VASLQDADADPGKTPTHLAFCILVGLGNGRILPLMFKNHPKKIPEVLIFNWLFLKLNRLIHKV
jgi:hypothetical protein